MRLLTPLEERRRKRWLAAQRGLAIALGFAGGGVCAWSFAFYMASRPWAALGMDFAGILAVLLSDRWLLSVERTET